MTPSAQHSIPNQQKVDGSGTTASFAAVKPRQGFRYPWPLELYTVHIKSRRSWVGCHYQVPYEKLRVVGGGFCMRRLLFSVTRSMYSCTYTTVRRDSSGYITRQRHRRVKKPIWQYANSFSKLLGMITVLTDPKKKQYKFVPKYKHCFYINIKYIAWL